MIPGNIPNLWIDLNNQVLRYLNYKNPVFIELYQKFGSESKILEHINNCQEARAKAIDDLFKYIHSSEEKIDADEAIFQHEEKVNQRNLLELSDNELNDKEYSDVWRYRLRLISLDSIKVIHNFHLVGLERVNDILDDDTLSNAKKIHSILEFDEFWLASEELTSDRNYVYNSLINNEICYNYISSHLKEDPNIALLAIQKNIDAVVLLPNTLLTNESFIRTALTCTRFKDVYQDFIDRGILIHVSATQFENLFSNDFFIKKLNH